MRILVTATTFPTGEGDTSPRFVLDLTKAIRAEGNCECCVLVPHWPGSKGIETLEGVDVHRFRYAIPEGIQSISGQGIVARIKENRLRVLLVPLLLLSQMVATFRLMMRFKPDALMAHWIIPQGVIGAIVKKLWPSCRVLVISHGGDAALIARSTLLRKLAAWVFESVDEVVAVSSFIKQKLRDVAPQFSEKIHVIPMGVDLSRFKSVDADATSSSRSGIIFVGRLEEKKGVEVLLRSFSKLLDSRPNEHLSIVGSGTLAEKLKERSKQLGIAGSVDFLGAISQTLLVPQLRKHAVAVVPSIDLVDDVEGMPTVITEFAAMNIPVIATDAGGISDFITDGETGLLVKQKDANDLCKLMLKLCVDVGLRTRIAVKARNYMLSNFSYVSVGRRYFLLLKA